MKVLFLTRHEPEVTSWKAQNSLARVRHLPCEMIECYSAAAVQKHVTGADYVLLDLGYMHVPYWSQVIFLNKKPVQIGRFHVDLWHKREAGAPPNWEESTIKVDFRLVAYQKLTEKHRPNWSGKTFWSPHCIDVQDYSIPRDIDVLFWGAYSEYYPFRTFARNKLRSLIVGNPKKVDSFLTMRSIRIDGNIYRFGEVKFTPNPTVWRRKVTKQVQMGYYGQRLFRLLSRSKIVVTGPAWRVPVGKYFEHAACGCVTMSPDFTDREALGFSHRNNIWLTDKARFVTHLRHLLRDEASVSKMSVNAKELVRTRHTPSVRGRELYEFLQERLGSNA